MSIVIVQWTDLLICKTRKNSIIHQGMTCVQLAHTRTLAYTLTRTHAHTPSTPRHLLALLSSALAVVHSESYAVVWWTVVIVISAETINNFKNRTFDSQVGLLYDYRLWYSHICAAKGTLNSNYCMIRMKLALETIVVFCLRIKPYFRVIGSRPSDRYFRSVCLSVCLFVCRVFLSRLWSDFDQTRTHVICLGLVVSARI